MSRKLIEQFGSSGRTREPLRNMQLVMSEEITDATTHTLEPEAGAMYLLFSREFNASSGNFYGERVVVFSAPEIDVYGTTDCNRGNLYASQNSGISVTYANDSSVTFARSSATYAVRFAVYRVF